LSLEPIEDSGPVFSRVQSRPALPVARDTAVSGEIFARRNPSVPIGNGSHSKAAWIPCCIRTAKVLGSATRVMTIANYRPLSIMRRNSVRVFAFLRKAQSIWLVTIDTPVL
jgi:hypothetical protein